MTTASKVTMARIGMIPAFMLCMYIKFPYSWLVALIIFGVAAVTDSVDGYIARKFNQVTNFGKFIDPLADKLLVTAAILIFVERGQMPAWAAMIIITREFAVTALRLVAFGEGTVIAARMSGKVKTTVSVIGISFMISHLHSVLLFGFVTVDVAATAAIVITTAWSGFDYFAQNGKFLDVRT